MDILSYAIASKQSRRIKKFIANPDSNSGVLTVPKTIELGQTITIPYGRVAILPDINIEGEIIIEGEVFIPSGGSYNQVDMICDNIKSKDKTYTVITKNLVDTVKDQDITGKKNFTNGLTTQGENITPYTGFKNYILNGDLKVWQRGKSVFNLTAGTYAHTADRWLCVSYGNCAGNISFLNGERTYIRSSCTSFVSGYFDITNKIEGTTQFKAGKYYTLSFTYSSDAVSSLILQDYNGSSYNVWLASSIPASAGNKKYSITFLSKNTATDFTNSFLNVIFRLQNVGSINISEVQLEEGTVATGFEQRPYGLELALCKRYYEVFNFPSGTAITIGSSVSSNGGNVYYNLPITPKRTTPTFGSTGAFTFRQGGSDNSVTALGVLQYTPDSNFIQLYSSHSSISNGYSGSLFTVGSCSLAFNAELP